MKLIQITDSKPESKNSTRLKRYGLFECPVCKEHVEKPLSHGRRNKSCGKRECRKATFTNPNNESYTGKSININNQKVNSRNQLRYFAGFRAWYNRLDKKYIHSDIDTIEKAANELYLEYEITKIQYPNQKITVSLHDLNKPITKNNAYFTIESKSTGLDPFQYNLNKLNKESLLSKDKIINIINKYNYDIVNDYDNILSECVVEKHSHNKQTEYLYLISAGIYTKIGVAKKLENRLKEISTGCPIKPEIKLIKQLGKLCYLVERYLHIKFANKCSNGEWFELTEEDMGYIQNTSNEQLVKEAAIELTKNKQEYIESTRVYNNNEKLNKLRKEAEERYIKACENYEKQKEEARKLNEKPQIETVHEEIEQWDRTSQIEACTTHGMSKTPLYKAWQTMKKVYKVIDEWQTFEPFKRVVEEEYNKFTEEQLARVYPVDSKVPIGPDNYEIKPKAEHKVKSAVAKAVEQLDKDGCVVAKYRTVTEAAKSVGGIASKISAVCRGTRKSHAGYKWKYLD